MKSKLMETGAQGGRTFVLIFDTGEEAVAGLKAFAGENGVNGAQVTAIGALERGVVAWLNWETKDYEPVRVDEQCEVISVLGDVAKDEDGKPSLHLHGVLGLKGGRTVGGHVQALHVRPTLEVVLMGRSCSWKRRLTCVANLVGISAELPSSMSTPANNYRSVAPRYHRGIDDRWLGRETRRRLAELGPQPPSRPGGRSALGFSPRWEGHLGFEAIDMPAQQDDELAMWSDPTVLIDVFCSPDLAFGGICRLALSSRIPHEIDDRGEGITHSPPDVR